MLSLVLTAPAAHVLASGPLAPASYRTALRDRPAAMARSWTPATEIAHHEARQEGNLNPGGGEGTWGTVMGPEQVWGPGLGKLADHATRFPRHPNLACTNEATPCGESHTAIRPRYRRPSGRDTDGHTAERRRTIVPAVSTPTKGQRKKKSRQKRYSTGLAGREEPWCTPPGWSRSSVLGPKAWDEKETNRKEHSVIVMFPYISMPVRSTISMRTFNFLNYYE